LFEPSHRRFVLRCNSFAAPFLQIGSGRSILPPRDLPHCRPAPRLYFRCCLQSFPPGSLQCDMKQGRWVSLALNPSYGLFTRPSGRAAATALRMPSITFLFKQAWRHVAGRRMG
jgi:hypothetical protein